MRLVTPLMVVTLLALAGHLVTPGGTGAEPPDSSLGRPLTPDGPPVEGRVPEDPTPFMAGALPVPAPAVNLLSLPPDPETLALEEEPPAARPPAVVWDPEPLALPGEVPGLALGEPAPTPAPPPYQIEENQQVRRFLDLFQTGPRRALVELWLARAGRYLPMILEVFRQKGLPEDLVFTAMIESGFNPIAVSRAGAKGLWQFMAPTARRYGLRVDRWLDERLDPEKSTVAAANHLLDLYAVFGSWNLVQAAYNAGEMKVIRAIRDMGTTDFWALARGRHLKEETKNFVPQIQAVSLIGREPDRYGFQVTPEEPLRYDVVRVPHSTALKRIAGLAGLPLLEVERLNPELTRKQTPPGDAYPLKVPVGDAVKVQVALEREASTRALAAAPPGKRGAGRAPPGRDIHVVRARETLGGIAKRYGVTVDDIARWNGLDDVALIRPGDRLRVASLSTLEEDQGGFR